LLEESAGGSISPLISVGIKDVIPHSTGFVMISEGWRTVFVELEFLDSVLCELQIAYLVE
jgi:hypothetical protein